MNTGKRDGNQLEIELYNKLKQHNGLTVKSESEIKKEYYDFCSGVDILCFDANKSLYIQCKFAKTGEQIEGVNHFILSAKCIENEKIKSNEPKLLWVSKVKPTLIGEKSLKYFNGEIIENNDLYTLIKNTEEYVLNFFEIKKNDTPFIKIEPIMDKNTVIYQNYKRELIDAINKIFINHITRTNIITLIDNRDIKKLEKYLIKECDNYDNSHNINYYDLSSLQPCINNLICSYNKLYNKSVMLIKDNEFYYYQQKIQKKNSGFIKSSKVWNSVKNINDLYKL